MSQIKIDHLFKDWYVVDVLGYGGFGTVYKIERNRFGNIERAALKVMHIPSDRNFIYELRANGYNDVSIKQRLKSDLDSLSKEYSRMREVMHTNIVNCDDIEWEENAGEPGYTIYIKMELLTPLIASLQNGFEPEKTAIKLAKDICSALVTCERRNIVHRDIKPQNLFINKYGEYKLGDFGIAREMDHATAATKTGTISYMAPEVFNGLPYGPNVDVYSLGLVLYWMLNERHLPFVPITSSVPSAQDMDNAILRRLKGQKIPEPLHGSAALKRIVLKACMPNPADRYQSANEMLRDLRALNARQNYSQNSTEATVPADSAIHESNVKTSGGSYGFVVSDVVKKDSAKQEVYQKKESETVYEKKEQKATPTETQTKAPYYNDTIDSICKVIFWFFAISFVCATAVIIPMTISQGKNLLSEPSVWWCVAIAGFSVFAVVKRDDFSTAANIIIALVLLIPTIFGIGNNIFKEKQEMKIENKKGIIDTSEKAEKLFKSLNSKTEENVEKEFGTDTFVFNNCTVDTTLSEITKSYYDKKDYTGRFKFGNKWYKCVVYDRMNYKSTFEKLDTKESYNITFKLTSVDNLEKDATSYTTDTMLEFYSAVSAD